MPVLVDDAPQDVLNRPAKREVDETKIKLEQLQALADRRQDEINVLRAQLEQKDAQIGILRDRYEEQVGGGKGGGREEKGAAGAEGQTDWHSEGQI